MQHYKKQSAPSSSKEDFIHRSMLAHPSVLFFSVKVRRELPWGCHSWDHAASAIMLWQEMTAISSWVLLSPTASQCSSAGCTLWWILYKHVQTTYFGIVEASSKTLKWPSATGFWFSTAPGIITTNHNYSSSMAAQGHHTARFWTLQCQIFGSWKELNVSEHKKWFQSQIWANPNSPIYTSLA
jgi:hypothetical protein